jgi:hypothetical protein
MITRKLVASTFAASAILGLSAGAASSAPVPLTISSVVSTWHNVVGGANVDESLAGPTGGTASISWGFPLPGEEQSGYDFSGIYPTGPLDAPAIFDIGEFAHRNFTIATGGGIQSADLTVAISGDVGGVGFVLTPTYTFTHIETTNFPNGGVCVEGGVTPCPDLVSFALASGEGSTNFVLDGFVYSVSILPGFLVGDEFVNSFLTLEDQVNTAILRGEFTVAPIPVPAALPLLATAMAGLALINRRRNRSAA